MTQRTRWNNDPFLLCGTAGWGGGGLRADAGLRVGGLIRHRAAIAAHVSGAFADAAVHGRFTAGTHKKRARHVIDHKAAEMTGAFIPLNILSG